MGKRRFAEEIEPNSVEVIVARRDLLKTSGYSRCPYVYYGQGAEALREILSHGLGGHSSYFLTGMVAAAACVLTGIRLVKSRCGFAYAMVFFGLSSLVMSWGGLAHLVPHNFHVIA